MCAGAIVGCSAGSVDPIVEAHRGAAGYYPQNSRTAMLASLEDGYAGIELDLVLTADGVPVLSHDPWVHETLCERVIPETGGTVQTDGLAGLDGKVRIDGLTLEELQRQYVCGGPPDPDFPNAVVRAEPIMALDELLTALRFAEADTLVHLDVKVHPGWTPPADAYADAILGRWYEADPPQPYYVSADRVDVLQAFETWGATAGVDVDTRLSWPRFPVEPDDPAAPSAASIVLQAEAALALGTVDPLRRVEDNDFDGLMMYWELADRHTARIAADRGYTMALWTINEPHQLTAHARWPLAGLITDYPADRP